MKRSSGVMAILLPLPPPSAPKRSTPLPLATGNRIPTPLLLPLSTAANPMTPFPLETGGQLVLQAATTQGNRWARFAATPDWEALLSLVPGATLLLPCHPRQVGAYWYQYPRIDTLHLPYFALPAAAWSRALPGLALPLALHLDRDTGTLLSLFEGDWLSDTDVHQLVRSLPDWPARNTQPIGQPQNGNL